MKKEVKDGILVLGGVKATDLIKEFGSPLYVIEEDVVVNTIRKFKNTMDKLGNGLVVYASKALNCKAICELIQREGAGLDVVSDGELYTAKVAGVDMKNIVFHGCNKTLGEIEMAIENDVGRIVVDGEYEIDNIIKVARKLNKTANVMLRINPGIDVHTHSYIRTGQIDSKFGMAIFEEETDEVVKKALDAAEINFVGFHCHIGSQIFEIQPYKDAAKIMLSYLNHIKEKYGYEVNQLDLGGGFGIQYTEKDDPPKYEDFITAIFESVTDTCKKLDFKIPLIIVEPGRSIIGEAGTTLYTAGAIKKIKLPDGKKTYVMVDGGMTDNIRYALYKAEYTAVVANKMNLPKDTMITLAGKCCESGDLIGENMPIQNVESGDIIAVFSTGAYCYSMSSNYNRILRPAMVMVKNGKARKIIKEETYESIIQNDL